MGQRGQVFKAGNLPSLNLKPTVNNCVNKLLKFNH